MAAGQGGERAPVDWGALRRRVEEAGRLLAGEEDASPGEVRAILEARARELARPLLARGEEETPEAVVFTLSGESYAVESSFVVEVCRGVELTPVPGVEAPVAGITVRRGEILTVLDLRSLRGPVRAAEGAPSQMIVLGERRPAFGILVDAVQELIRILPSEVRRLPDGRERGEHLRGVTRQSVLVLDAMELMRAYG